MWETALVPHSAGSSLNAFVGELVKHWFILLAEDLLSVCLCLMPFLPGFRLMHSQTGSCKQVLVHASFHRRRAVCTLLQGPNIYLFPSAPISPPFIRKNWWAMSVLLYSFTSFFDKLIILVLCVFLPSHETSHFSVQELVCNVQSYRSSHSLRVIIRIFVVNSWALRKLSCPPRCGC